MQDFCTTLNNWEKYWNNELDRPIVSAVISGVGGKVPGYHSFDAFYDFSMPPEQVVEIVLKNIANCRYYGDAARTWFPNFGPGALTAMIGGQGTLTDNTVWFNGGKLADAAPEELAFKFNPDSPWAQRIYAISAAAAKRGLDEIVVASTDIGGVTDVLASFRHGEAFLYDLYDRPDTVKRLVEEIHTAWFEAFSFLRSALGKDYPYSCWANILSKKPHNMLQSDVSYMISPEQFGEFVLPELKKSCLKLDRAFYHLDGKGELPHLDQLLSINELAGIQWIPGDGAPPLHEWPEVLNKIADSGKKLQLLGSVEHVAKALNVVHNLSAVNAFCHGSAKDIALAEKITAEYC
jgi:5-methyltetrahydrofolate--homocysteine methyltransferase